MMVIIHHEQLRSQLSRTLTNELDTGLIVKK